jgi:hypothetical protein
MAKLADAADLKSAGAKSSVGVQVPLPAPQLFDSAPIGHFCSRSRDWLREADYALCLLSFQSCAFNRAFLSSMSRAAFSKSGLSWMSYRR